MTRCPSDPDLRTPDVTATTSPEQAIPAYQERIEGVLDRALDPAGAPDARLIEAMRYATLSGGKRLRPLLVYATGEALGAPQDALDAAAAAVEMIHVYSLIHDDLPAMDDDDLRRGRPTCHRAYDEATAILAGDALQAQAFVTLSSGTAALPAGRAPVMLQELARAAGLQGMAGGQAIDLGACGGRLDLPGLEGMHRLKTGALIRASVRLGGLAGGADDALLTRLTDYAECIGLAFQIRDDILDVEGDPETLGKACGADARLDKSTFPALMGLEASRERAVALVDQALEALQPLDAEADLLRHLARYIVDRIH
ncbi:(2E,6E)-farnesyl diphosphate synthase [Thioalkalivibrio sp. AKL17]|uniref:(2E,6E)-farnesyl diphosphate synthase n=1 Tax=Thioalkalivibrio sp. AKL17 TaxID=1158160 RepID=UPI0003A82966|nr:farnesyl diphosphate synthase [Thioalkalivibrio sp. AKL17]